MYYKFDYKITKINPYCLHWWLTWKKKVKSNLQS